MKRYTQAPLPFQGQKRRFIHQIEAVTARQPRGSVFIALLGDGAEVHRHHVSGVALDYDDIMLHQEKPTRGIDSV